MSLEEPLSETEEAASTFILPPKVDILVSGGLCILDTVFALKVVYQLDEGQKNPGVASVLFLLIWCTGFLVVGVMAVTEEFSFSKWICQIVQAATFTTPIMEMCRSWDLGKTNAHLWWLVVAQGTIKGPMQMALIMYCVLIKVTHESWIVRASLLWSCLAVSRTLAKLDIYGRSSLGTYICRVGLRFVEVFWRVASVAFFAAMVRTPEEVLPLSDPRGQILIWPMLMLDFVHNFEMLYLVISKGHFSVHVLLAAIMVTASPPLFIPGAEQTMSGVYSRTRTWYFLFLALFVLNCCRNSVVTERWVHMIIVDNWQLFRAALISGVVMALSVFGRATVKLFAESESRKLKLQLVKRQAKDEHNTPLLKILEAFEEGNHFE